MMRGWCENLFAAASRAVGKPRGWERVIRALEKFRPRIIFEHDPAYVARGGGSWDEIARWLTELGCELFYLGRNFRMDKIVHPPPVAGNILALPR